MVDSLPLAGRTIGITADRRWQEQAGLFTARGATVLHGPTMRTVDLSGDEALRSATAAVIEDPPDLLVATTGMGVRMWLAAAEEWGQRDALLAALGPARIVARGAKSASAVKQTGLDVWWRAPHETMDEIVEHLSGQPNQIGRVAIQLFEPAGHPSTEAIRALATEVVEVPVYRWLLPDDVGPANRLIDAVVRGAVDAVTFTSQPAVHQLFTLADGRRDELKEALNTRVLPACIGPVCAEAAVEEGVTSIVYPEPSRLPAMVRQVTELLTS